MDISQPTLSRVLFSLCNTIKLPVRKVRNQSSLTLLVLLLITIFYCNCSYADKKIHPEIELKDQGIYFNGDRLYLGLYDIKKYFSILGTPSGEVISGWYVWEDLGLEIKESNGCVKSISVLLEPREQVSYQGVKEYKLSKFTGTVSVNDFNVDEKTNITNLNELSDFNFTYSWPGYWRHAINSKPSFVISILRVKNSNRKISFVLSTGCYAQNQ